MSRVLKSLSAALFVFSLGLTGCTLNPTPATSTQNATPLGAIHGRIMGGQQPITGMRVYVFAAGTGGYGTAATSLITDTTNPADTTTFGAGTPIYYELTDGSGNFTIGGNYTCVQGTQVYLYAVGGNPGSGLNANAGLLAGLGQCPNTGTMAAVTPFVFMNEVSTLAFAYAMAGYSTDPAHVASSGSATALTGIANAMANIANISNIADGTAYTTSVHGSGVVPQNKIYALADVLAACINSTGGTPNDGSSCGTLFYNVTSNGVACTATPCATAPTNTATAAIYMAKNPWNAPTTVFQLATGNPPFVTTDTSETDWAIGVTYAFVGASGGEDIATDGNGNVFASAFAPKTVEKYTPLGVSTNIVVSTGVDNLAVDSANNLWITQASTSIAEIPSGSSTPVTITPQNTTPANVLVQSTGIAFDGSGNIVVTDNASHNVLVLSPTGTYGSTGITYPGSSDNVSGSGAQNYYPAVDSSGNLWELDGGSSSIQIAEITPGATPPGTATYTPYSIPYNGTGHSGTASVALDSSQNVWASSLNCACLYKIDHGSSSGTAFAFPGAPYKIVIDGAGNIFSAGSGNTAYELNNNGTPVTTSNGYMSSFGTYFTQPDISGNLWVLGASHIEQFLGLATPTAAPLTPTNAGTRP